MNEKQGLSFTYTLCSIWRQNPEGVLVGEIRDEETARIALQASLSQHLVLSNLHTNDALIGVVSQRLVRRLCELALMTPKPTRCQRRCS